MNKINLGHIRCHFRGCELKGEKYNITGIHNKRRKQESIAQTRLGARGNDERTARWRHVFARIDPSGKVNDAMAPGYDTRKKRLCLRNQ